MKSRIIMVAALTALLANCVSIGPKMQKLDIGTKNNSEIQMLYNSLKSEGVLVNQEYSGNYDSDGNYNSHRVAIYKAPNGTLFKITMKGWDKPISINTIKGE